MVAAAALLPAALGGDRDGALDDVLGPDAVGTFAGFGADVRVRLSPRADEAAPPVELPVCALIAGWMRARRSRTPRAGPRLSQRSRSRRRAEPRQAAARRDRPAGRADRGAGRRRRREHADPGGPRRLPPGRRRRARGPGRRAGLRRRGRADPAARARSWGGSHFRCWPVWPSRDPGRPRSSTAERPTASATSPASGSRDGDRATAGDRRPDRHR